MFIARLEKGIPVEYPLTEKEVRRRLNNYSLPEKLTDEILKPLSYSIVPVCASDEVPQQTQNKRLVVGVTYDKVKKAWKRSYTLEVITDEGYKTRRLAKEWKSVRSKRDDLMNGFEWRIARYGREIILGSRTTDDIVELHTYMQKLSDITNAIDPFLIVFPEPPKSLPLETANTSPTMNDNTTPTLK